MQAFRSKDLERVLGVAPGVIRSLIRSGHISPGRGPRGVLLFSFQDLVVMRTVRSLVAAKVPARRIRRSLQGLRAKLPKAAPLAGLSISAVGDQIAVREGAAQWEGNSGQYLMAFDVTVDGNDVRIVDAQIRRTPIPDKDNDAQFASALALEDSNAGEAIRAYRACVAQDPGHLEAYINGGRLLHQAGRLREAAEFYRAAPQPNSTLLFNLGVVLEDQGRTSDALSAYQQALVLDPELADAHFNLARLYELAGNQANSLRHFSAYRKLTCLA